MKLDRFVYRAHPGTGMPKEFSSHVTKLDRGTARKVHITMNAPLREEGYTLYQSGWGPQDAMPGSQTRFYSSFSVVAKPTKNCVPWDSDSGEKVVP